MSFGEYDRQIKRWPENEGKLFHGFKEDISSLVNVKTRDQNKFHAHLIFEKGINVNFNYSTSMALHSGFLCMLVLCL